MIGFAVSPNQKRFIRSRIMLLLSVFFAFLVFLLFQVAYVQIIQWGKYRKYSQGQAEQEIAIHATRGQIYDRNGTLLVGNRPSYSLFITPAYFPKNKGENPQETVLRSKLLKYLSAKLDMSLSEIVKKITIEDQLKQNKYTPVLVKHDLSPKTYAELIEIPKKYLPGVEVSVSFMRNYLFKDTLSHVLGYTGMIDLETWQSFRREYGSGRKNPYHDKSTILGRQGIEKYQDLVLRGEDGLLIRMVDSKGRPIPQSTEQISDAYPGRELYLTVDIELQVLAKKLMTGKKGVILVSKPATGEILAFVSNPSFDPNEIISRDAERIHTISHRGDALLYNRVLQGRYPPGSIFKIIVALAGLENGVSPHREYMCRGAFQLGARVFKCTKSHGQLHMIEALEHSCNVYFYQLAQALGWEKVHALGQVFRLEDPVELEIGASSSGSLPDETWKKRVVREAWFTGDTLNHAIGQGYMLLTPIQLHKIISIIANDGKFHPFYLIQKTRDPLSQEEYVSPVAAAYDVPVSRRSLSVMQEALHGVTTHGTARGYSVFSDVPFAGKTSTAQHIIGAPTHAGFTAYAPYGHTNDTQDRIAITVLVESADGGGSFVASPMAVAILRFYFNKILLCQSQMKMGRYLGCTPRDEAEFRLGRNIESEYKTKLLLRMNDPEFLFEKKINALIEHYSEAMVSLKKVYHNTRELDWRKYVASYLTLLKLTPSFSEDTLRQEDKKFLAMYQELLNQVQMQQLRQTSPSQPLVERQGDSNPNKQTTQNTPQPPKPSPLTPLLKQLGAPDDSKTHQKTPIPKSPQDARQESQDLLPSPTTHKTDSEKDKESEKARPQPVPKEKPAAPPPKKPEEPDSDTKEILLDEAITEAF